MNASSVLVRFGHRLREEGIRVGPTISIDLADAAEAVGLFSAEDTYHAFRSVCITSSEQIPVFDRVFVEVFGGGPSHQGLAVVSERSRNWSIEAAGAADEGDSEASDQVEAVVGASWSERLWHKDFSELTPAEEAAVRRMIQSMFWRPAVALSRRRKPSPAGDRLDPRKTLSRLVGMEGDLMLPSFTRRRTRRRPLVFLADVSGSMERYSEMLLYFAHAAGGNLGRMEAFVFSTRLTRITHELRNTSPSEAIAGVAAAVSDWSGGTRIGDAIGAFNREWVRRVTSGGPIAIVVSDGWDRGDPDLLRNEMARLSRSVHRVVWLNPLASRPGFAPETRGMQAALPFVDDFLAAGRLADLASVVELLESVPARRRR